MNELLREMGELCLTQLHPGEEAALSGLGLGADPSIDDLLNMREKLTPNTDDSPTGGVANDNWSWLPQDSGGVIGVPQGQTATPSIVNGIPQVVTTPTPNISSNGLTAKSGAMAIGANAYVSNTPKPGSVALKPGTTQFNQAFSALAQGGSPMLQAQLAIAQQDALRRNAPVYVPPAVVQQAQTQSSLPLGWIIGGAGVLAVLAFILSRK